MSPPVSRASAASREPLVLGLASVAVVILLYVIVADRLARPELVPTARALVETAAALVRGLPKGGDGGHAAQGGLPPGSDHVGQLVRQGVTLQGALLASTARVLLATIVGAALGIVLGVAMGWNGTLGEFVHPLAVLARGVPPVALVTYAMVWLGHGEAHRLVPIAYAALVTVAVPAWRGTRDVAAVWIRAARALGAPPGLVVRRVLVPAITPSVLSGLRHALLVAWTTTLAVEMVTAEAGLGRVIAAGLRASGTGIAADPAVVMVALATIAAGATVTDTALRVATTRLTRWTQARP
jgi:sulfonate transport system permease protein